jgi:hypothetical protein
MYPTLDDKRTNTNATLSGVGQGSEFQDALEDVVSCLDDVEQEEDSISRQIASATQKLEQLELKVCRSFRARLQEQLADFEKLCDVHSKI